GYSSSDCRKNRHTQHAKVWQEKRPASRVLAVLASPPATKALDPDPFPCRSLRHAVYAAVLHFGLESASVNVADLLKKHGVRGNWLQLGDETEHGAMGPVAELEALAQTAFRQACGDQAAVMARPARISKARKTLGKVHRTKL